MSNVNHIHCLMRAYVDDFFMHAYRNEPDVTANVDLHLWVDKLVEALDMKIMFGPFSFYNERPELEGWSVLVGIETSSITIHAFPYGESVLLEIDVYTCGKFDRGVVCEALKQFGLQRWSWKTIDRGFDALPVIDQGAEAFL